MCAFPPCCRTLPNPDRAKRLQQIDGFWRIVLSKSICFIVIIIDFVKPAMMDICHIDILVSDSGSSGSPDGSDAD